MKKLLFLWIIVSSPLVFTEDYNIVLIKLNENKEYQMAKMKLTDLKKYPSINVISNFVNITSHLYENIIGYCIYSSNLIYNEKGTQIDIDPFKPQKLDKDVKKNKESSNQFLKKISLYLLYAYLSMSKYFQNNRKEIEQREDNLKSRDKLIEIFGGEKLSLLFQYINNSNFNQMVIIADEHLNYCLNAEIFDWDIDC